MPTKMTTSSTRVGTLSQVRPHDLAAAVGDLGAACECVHCPPHRRATRCKCDRAAGWMVVIAHLADNGRGESTCSGRVIALCDVCRRAALQWAEQTSRAINQARAGRCPACNGTVQTTSDIIRAIVAL